MNQIVQLFSFLLPCDLEAPDEALSASASALAAQYTNTIFHLTWLIKHFALHVNWI